MSEWPTATAALIYADPERLNLDERRLQRQLWRAKEHADG